MRLADKVAIITGAASGMGAATARRFGREGAKVVIADMLTEEGKAVADSINATGGEALFVTLNVTDEAGWKDVVDVTVRAFGKLDILVNNAGISGSATNDLLDSESVGAGDGGEQHRRVPGHRRRRAADATERWRLDRQSFIHFRRCRPEHGAHELQRREGRGADHDQIHRRAVRQGQDPLQLGASRADAADAHLRRHRGSGGPRQDAEIACRLAAPGKWTKSPTPSCSWRRTKRPILPERNYTSMVAIWRCKRPSSGPDAPPSPGTQRRHATIRGSEGRSDSQ